jgi:alkyl hydroperoxide reductase subunit F
MITVYSKAQCPNCDQAKAYLKSKNINFREVRIDEDTDAREFIQGQGHRAVPQIYMDGRIFVEGGWQGLSKMTADEILSEIELRESLQDQTL